MFSDTTVVAGDSACVSVYAFQASPVAAFDFFVDYDAALINLSSLSNVNAKLTGIQFDTVTGGILFSEPGGLEVALADCERMFDICFDGLGAGGVSTTLGIDETRPVNYENLAGAIAVVDSEGTVTITAGGGGGGPGGATPCDGLSAPTLVFADTTVASGAGACVPVYAFQIGPVAAFDFFLDYDPAVVDLAAPANVHPLLAAGLQLDTVTGGVLFSEPGGLEVTLPDCAVAFEVCFEAVGAGGTASPLGIDETRAVNFDALSGPFAVAEVPGTVTVTAGGGGGPTGTPCDGLTQPTLVFGDTTVTAGMSGCLPVYAYQVSPIAAFDFTVDFDPALIDLAPLGNVNPLIAMGVQFDTTTGGVLFSEPGGLEVTIPDCALLFDICFDALGSAAATTQIGIDETAAVNFENLGPSSPIAVVEREATVTILAGGGGPGGATPCDGLSAPTLVFADTTVASGAGACVPVYAFQIGPVAAFDFFLDYDPAVVDLAAPANVHPLLAAGLQLDTVTGGVLFSEPGGLEVTLPDCAVAFEVCFEAVGAGGTASPLGIDETRAVNFDALSGPFAVAEVPGTVTVTGGTTTPTFCDDFTGPTVAVTRDTGRIGDTVSVAVIGFGLSALSDFAFDLNHNAAVAIAIDTGMVNALIRPGFSLEVGADSVSVVFDEPTGADVAFPDCDTLFTVLYRLIGADGDSTDVDLGLDRPVPSFASSAGPISVQFEEGRLLIDDDRPVVAPCDAFAGPTLFVGRDSAETGETVCLPLIGYRLGEVTAFDLTLEYDETLLTFSDTGSVDVLLRGGLTVDAPNDRIAFDTAGIGSRGLFACDTLATLCFELIGANGTQSPVGIAGASTVTGVTGAQPFDRVAGEIRINGTVVLPCDTLTVTPTVGFPSCNGDDDGTITLAVSGGDGTDYSYQWADGPTTRDRTGLAAGTYEVTVTSCMGAETKILAIIVGQPDPLVVNDTVTDVACNGEATGIIDITPVGGTPDYSYQWTGPGVMPGFQDQENIIAGTYTVRVTDARGCFVDRTFAVAENPAIVVASDVTQPTAGGAADGAIDLTVSGGVGSFTFAWTGPGVDASAEDQTGLAAGNYDVVVTDGAGCTVARSFALEEGAPNLSVTSTPSCPDGATGTIDLTITGGTAPFDITWDGGLPAQEDHTDVAAGTYNVTVLDAAGKTATASVTVAEHPTVALAAAITPVRGTNDGAIDLTVSGGVGPYAYLWSTNATTEDISGLDVGQYSVTVTDQGTGCTFSGTYDVTRELVPIRFTRALTDVSCNASNGGVCDGALELNITEGVGPFTVTFAGGPAIGLPATAVFATPGTQTFTGLCPGSFDILIADAAGVTANETGLTIAEPAEIVITDVVIRPVVGTSASNGGIDIEVAGGTPPYRYAWSNGSTNQDLTNLAAGTYTVEITDANDCVLQSNAFAVTEFRITTASVSPVVCADDPNGSIDIEVAGGIGPFSYDWSNGATTQDLDDVPAGTYEVTVTDDASGAQLVASYTIAAQSTIDVTAIVTSSFGGGFEISCVGAADGSAIAEASGASGNVDFSWSSGDGTALAVNLAAGSYTVTGTDALGCTDEAIVTLEDPDSLVADLVVNDISCAGQQNGRITAFPSGGAGDYSYNWSNGVFTRVNPNLPAGSYTLTVTDGNGCDETFVEGVAEPQPITAEIDVENATTVAPGSITIRGMGGTAPYRYRVGNDTSSNPTFSLPFGVYEVSVTDANGCDPFVASVTVENGDFVCYDASDVITPGLMDGLNDVLVIQCIEDSPDNTVQIFNRWGQEVRTYEGYDNADVQFDGRQRNGELLPEGGYFYVIRYRDGNNDQQIVKGSFTLLR